MADRAVSITVGYALNLMIATLLLSGLFIAGGSLVQSERERAIENELDVAGQQIAADLMTADRLVKSADDPGTVTVEIDVSLPNQVAGSSYTIELRVDDGEIVLESTRPAVEVTVPFVITAENGLSDETLSGGDITIRWSDGSLEVESA